MVGIDEVGRGSLAGPLLVIVARASRKLPGVRDSKLLSRGQREKVYLELLKSCSFGEGWVTPVEIDTMGLTDATRLGVSRALKHLSVSYNERIILDGRYNYLPAQYVNFECRAKADKTVPIVSAASIYAKVMRDHYMHQLAKQYPKYQFDKHVGYGTKLHYSRIDLFGPLSLVHRESFRLIRDSL